MKTLVNVSYRLKNGKHFDSKLFVIKKAIDTTGMFGRMDFKDIYLPKIRERMTKEFGKIEDSMVFTHIVDDAVATDHLDEITED